MATFHNGGLDGTQQEDRISDDVVTKVGAAVAKIALIQQAWSSGEADGTSMEMAEDQMQRAAMQAISEEGVSINEYNAVLSEAETDPDLEERLLAAAREAF